MNRRAVILNGSMESGGALDVIQTIIANELKGGAWTVDTVALGNTPIAGCLGCFECWVKTPGVCRINDAGREVARMVIASDVTILLTPVTFGGYCSELKKAVDRLIPLISPYFMKIHGEIHHRPRYTRYPRLIAIGGLSSGSSTQGRDRHQDSELQALFKTVVHRNAVNLHAPAHGVGFVHDGQELREMSGEFKRLWSEVGVTA